ncbi:hypothetical protein GTY75_05330 [Streptomyces sp. SID8381]|uniref:hypothetical protein n=1 Tax=unclassified Streptomyces TaxID=2593676 RepID=UPI0003811706|nr:MULTISPECIES: hypothetical protein [unclassified Streptomyces]MYX26095.1 hypothetical protein [Streptomyces sp. SID8381]
MSHAEADPTADELVKRMYSQANMLADEMKHEDDYKNFDLEDWKTYAVGLASAFRGLDMLLRHGSMLPDAWATAVHPSGPRPTG